MSNQVKNAIYSAALLLAILVVWFVRNAHSGYAPVEFEGVTMGTTYHIAYFDPHQRNFKVSIDSLLDVFNASLSTYIPDSEISVFNAQNSFVFKLPFFYPVLKKSHEVYEATYGAFDPSVMPLVSGWGFGPAKQESILDSIQVKMLMERVGMDKITFTTHQVNKRIEGVQLDFSAVAKGYAVDVVTQFLTQKGMKNLFVEIGGEVSARGENLEKGGPWIVGILDPNSTYDHQDYYALANLSDLSLATSGNYFNYRVIEGQKFSHTIDPKTGYPVKRKILSASIFAEDCMTADAWATACMVMGHQKVIPLLKDQPHIKAFLIYAEGEKIRTYQSTGLESILKFKK